MRQTSRKGVSRREFLRGAAAGAAGIAAMSVLGVGASAQEGTAMASGYIPGTYTAVTKGFGGDVWVTITVDESSIKAVEIVGDQETVGVGSRAVEWMPDQILAAQSAEVDGVAGATMTSNAVRGALREALSQASAIADAPVRMYPGTYIAAARGFSNTEEIPFKITVSETELLSIEKFDPVDSCETEVILQSVLDLMVPRMIALQSLSVDSICGATMSSAAVRNATEQALKQALRAGGSDESAIRHFYVTPEKTGLGTTETLDYDMLVVGTGTAGILCATSAIETFKKQTGKDLRVLLIDKAGKIAGTAGMAHEPFAVNPPRLREETNEGKDWVDAAELRNAWLTYTTDYEGRQRAKVDMVDLMLSESGKTIDWLKYEHGYTFAAPSAASVSAGSTSQGAGAISTSAYVVRFNYAASNINYELRRPQVDAWLKTMIREYIEPAGGRVMLETEGYELLYDNESGAAIGAKARSLVDGTEYVINAPVVVSATGGFGGSSEYTKKWIQNEYYPHLGSEGWVLNGMYQNDGKFIAAALAVSADTYNISNIPITMQDVGTPVQLHMYPVNARIGEFNNRTGRYATWSLNDIPVGLLVMPNNLAVNRLGERVCNEEGVLSKNEGDFITPRIIISGSRFYSLVDTAQLEKLAAYGFPSFVKWTTYFGQGGVLNNKPLPEIYEVLEHAVAAGYVYKADTIAELAEQMGMDSDTLNDTVARYNALCEQGNDEDFFKNPAYLDGLRQGPFYAVTGCPRPFQTGGALNVDTKLRVLRADDHETPIHGLYALGGDSMGVLLSDHMNYIGYGGMAQGWCITSGRLAGISAGEYLAEKL